MRRLKPHRWILHWLVFFPVLLVPSLAEPWETGWFHRAWQTEDGLASNSVTGICQTPDGRLWVATHKGLTTFDGVSFRAVDLPIPSGRVRPIVRGMDQDAEGTLWLALEGGMVAHLVRDGMDLLRRHDGLPAGQPWQVAAEAGGAVWVAFRGGRVVRIEGEQVLELPAGSASEGAREIRTLVRDSSGAIWFARDGAVGRLTKSGEEVLHEIAEGRSAIAAAREGGVWFLKGGRLHRLRAGTPKVVATLPAAALGAAPLALLEDSLGGIWLGTEGAGLWRFDGETFRSVETSHPVVLALAEDREGNIWAGTDGGGLNRLRPRWISLHGEADGLPMPVLRSLDEDQAGRIWATTLSGTLLTYEDRRWREAVPEAGWKENRALCVVGGADGAVWVGGYGGGLYRREPDGKWSALGEESGFAGGIVRAMHVGRGGDLWIAQERPTCLQRWRAGRFETHGMADVARPVRAIAEDADGTVWFGGMDGRLYRFDGDGLAGMTDPSMAGVRPIRCLLPAERGGLWIGFAVSGLGLWEEGELTFIGDSEGLPDANICAIQRDDMGGLWISSDQGIYRVAETELLEVARGVREQLRPLTFGRDEGLSNLQGNYGYGPGSLRTTDGRLWFPMRNGLAVVRPHAVVVGEDPLPAAIEQIRVDGDAVVISGGGIKLKPGHRGIDVRFTAYRFHSPEDVVFRHRLVGWQDNWSEPSTLRQVGFSRLPAGTYRLEVAARIGSGGWSEPPVAVSIEVDPFFWEHWWFRTAAVVVFTMFVAAVVRFVSFRRLTGRLRRLEQEAAVQRERSRIAQDLHDDLGSSLTQISLLSRLAEHDSAQAQLLSGHLREISTVARRGVESVDEIVWAVNPRNDTVAHLLEYAGQHAVDFLRAADIRCRIDIPNTLPSTQLRADVRHGLFLVIKEALNNIVKHAGATEVKFHARVDGERLLVVVDDNGRGVAVGDDDTGGDGLRNMRQRVREFGGSCEIAGNRGKGTRVRIDLPLRATKESDKHRRHDDVR
jgi:signal transduction histidine kinase/ligand-binding sensor domain-containing protein